MYCTWSGVTLMVNGSQTRRIPAGPRSSIKKVSYGTICYFSILVEFTKSTRCLKCTPISANAGRLGRDDKVSAEDEHESEEEAVALPQRR